MLSSGFIGRLPTRIPRELLLRSVVIPDTFIQLADSYHFFIGKRKVKDIKIVLTSLVRMHIKRSTPRFSIPSIPVQFRNNGNPTPVIRINAPAEPHGQCRESVVPALRRLDSSVHRSQQKVHGVAPLFSYASQYANTPLNRCNRSRSRRN